MRQSSSDMTDSNLFVSEVDDWTKETFFNKLLLSSYTWRHKFTNNDKCDPHVLVTGPRKRGVEFSKGEIRTIDVTKCSIRVFLGNSVLLVTGTNGIQSTVDRILFIRPVESA